MITTATRDYTGEYVIRGIPRSTLDELRSQLSDVLGVNFQEKASGNRVTLVGDYDVPTGGDVFGISYFIGVSPRDVLFDIKDRDGRGAIRVDTAGNIVERIRLHTQADQVVAKFASACGLAYERLFDKYEPRRPRGRQVIPTPWWVDL